MIRLNKKRSLWIIGVSIIGVMLATIAYAYINYTQDYALLTVAQLDYRLISPTIKFTKISNDVLDNNAKLKETSREVISKYRDVGMQCHPLVYCDLASNTKSTKSLTFHEFESLQRTFQFSSVEYSDGRVVWQSYISDDCAYPQGYPGIRDVNGQQECYYSILLETIEDQKK